MTQQKSYYAIIPANVRYDSDLTSNAKLLYGEITALCNERGYCWAENSYFANLYGVSKTSISKWISALSNKGYISTQIVYKESSKEIEARYITIVNQPIEEKLNTSLTFVNEPIEEKLNTSNINKLQYNNNNNNNKLDDNIYIVEFGKKVEKIISYLNEKANTNYRSSTNKTRTLIQARLNEKFTLEDFKRVIDNKCADWKGTEWEQYLRPETLFGTKFENYLNRVNNSKKSLDQILEEIDF